MQSTDSPTPRGMAAICCVLFIGVLAVAASAGAQDGWQSPLLIPAAEFENSGFSPMEDNFFDVDGYVSGRQDALLAMVAPVQLPQFATITRFEAAVVDIGDCPTVPDPVIQLRSVNFSTGEVTIHAHVTGADNGQMEIFADTSITNPSVNNLSHAYFVGVNLCGPFQALHGVRIHFTE